MKTLTYNLNKFASSSEMCRDGEKEGRELEGERGGVYVKAKKEMNKSTNQEQLWNENVVGRIENIRREDERRKGREKKGRDREGEGNICT